MIIQNTFFFNSKNQKISARIYKTPEKSHKGVIYCHGLFSSKEGYKITTLAGDIVNAGYNLFTFDFSFCGESGGHISEISILQEVDDLKCAYNFFTGQGASAIHLAGSSMGGVVSLLFAAHMKQRIESLTLIATPVMLHNLMQKIAGITDLDSLPDDGMTDVEGYNLNNRFFKEVSQAQMDYAVSQIKIPTLIIQGTKDEVVDSLNAEVLRKNINCAGRIVLIENGDHSLTKEKEIEVIKNNMLEWFSRH